MMPQLPIDERILTSKLEEIFGSQAHITGWSPLTGGARKKVIRLRLSGSLPDLVLLVWQNEHDYFGERDNPDSDRSDQVAPLLYQANTELLLSNGVRVPQLYHFDATCRQFPFAYALVEYVQAITFNEWLPDRSRPEIQQLFSKISVCLERMHLIKRDTYGILLDDSPKTISCHEQAFQEALQGLSGLAEAMESVRVNKTRVQRKLEELSLAIEPRNRYSFIHDELGPDEHLLIDPRDEIVLIDIDGCHFFDLEREHAYLKLRFGEYYEYLRRDDLDENRMRFYTFCLHIIAAYGHFLLYQQGFPDPEMLRGIYEWNIHQFLLTG